MRLFRNAHLLSISLITLAALLCLPAAAQSPDQASTVVTAIYHGSGPMPPISQEDVVVRQNGKVRRVISWHPLSGPQAGLDVAVLIDDSLSGNVALQWEAVRQFIASLPPQARVAVAYGQYGSATFMQRFTTDHALAGKALRLPLGKISSGASIYMSVTDLVRHWPADNNRGVILLVSDGVDTFYGIRESEPGQNINLQHAINQAQKRGVMVYTIFASGASSFSKNLYLLNNGQGCLARLALETGGASFQQGLQTPLDFAPYLKQIEDRLSHQYLLTFEPDLGRKADYARLQLAVEKNGVELRAPARIFLPAAR
jgi:VWFA-related protein